MWVIIYSTHSCSRAFQGQYRSHTGILNCPGSNRSQGLTFLLATAFEAFRVSILKVRTICAQERSGSGRHTSAHPGRNVAAHSSPPGLPSPPQPRLEFLAVLVYLVLGHGLYVPADHLLGRRQWCCEWGKARTAESWGTGSRWVQGEKGQRARTEWTLALTSRQELGLWAGVASGQRDPLEELAGDTFVCQEEAGEAESARERKGPRTRTAFGERGTRGSWTSIAPGAAGDLERWPRGHGGRAGGPSSLPRRRRGPGQGHRSWQRVAAGKVARTGCGVTTAGRGQPRPLVRGDRTQRSPSSPSSSTWSAQLGFELRNKFAGREGRSARRSPAAPAHPGPRALSGPPTAARGSPSGSPDSLKLSSRHR